MVLSVGPQEGSSVVGLMRILLAGAGGAIGSHLIPQLLEAGHTVAGISRSASGARRIADLGADPVIADILDAAALDAAVAGREADAVIHQATSLEKTPILHRHLRLTNTLRTEGTKNLLRTAHTLGAWRFVTQSFFLGYGYGDPGDGWIAEDDGFGRLNGDAFDEHLTAMASNEDQVLLAPDIEGVALRYGLFYGDDRSTATFRDLAKKRQLPVAVPSATTSVVHLADAAAATVAALDRGRAGEAYNVADDHPPTFEEFLGSIAASVGAKPPLRIPAWTLRPLPYLHALMSKTRIKLSNAKAKEHLGWTPQYPHHRDGLAAS